MTTKRIRHTVLTTTLVIAHGFIGIPHASIKADAMGSDATSGLVREVRLAPPTFAI
jgi:hypothetical protein